MPVIQATREAEAGESLKPRRWKLQWAEITPLHFSLGNKQDSISKQTNKPDTIIHPPRLAKFNGEPVVKEAQSQIADKDFKPIYTPQGRG